MQGEVRICKQLNIVIYEREVTVARILANYFHTDVFLVHRQANAKTPDLKIGNQYWEIKSPIGASRRTIENNLRKASRQSSNVIIDLHRIRVSNDRAIRRAKDSVKKVSVIDKALVIDKNFKVIRLK